MKKTTMLALALLALLWLARRGRVSARIFGADVAPGIDVTPGSDHPIGDADVIDAWGL